MEKRHTAYDNVRFFDLEYRPPSYIGLFGRLPILRSHHPVFCVFLFEAIPVLGYEGIRFVSKHEQTLSEALIVYFGTAITMLASVFQELALGHLRFK